MKLKIPFFRQTTKLNCGPIALKMVLAYFGNDVGIEVLEERTGIKEGKGISTIQIATASASLGYKSDFYSKHILFNEENLKHEFYQNYADNDLIEQEWVNKAKAIVERTKEDPRLQNKEINKFKADYIKKRYNRVIKVSEE